jgi:hydrogen cyanide synthase HcnB
MAEGRVVIVGAGPAGTRAAEALVRNGLRPVVVDEGLRSGGQIYRRQPDGFARPAKTLYGFEAGKATRLHRDFESLLPRLDYRPGTLVWAIRDGVLHTSEHQTGRTATIPFDALILSTGATDRVIPFPGWTKPGVYTLGGSQIALKYQGCAIGSRIVFLGTGPLLTLVAYQYVKAGAQVAAVLDTTPFATAARESLGLLAIPATFAKGLYYTAQLRLHGIPVHRGVTPLAAEGEPAVSALRFRDAEGQEQRIECDAIGFGYHVQPEPQLADLAGCEFEYDATLRQWRPRIDPDGRSSQARVYVAGDSAQVRGADAAERAGALAAYAALADLGRPAADAPVAQLRDELARATRFAEALKRVFPVPHHFVGALADDTVLCRCELITVGEVRRAATALGAEEINRAKALTRVGMGRCQGRFCGFAAAQVLAHALGIDPQEVTRLRGQAPVKPIPIMPEAEREPA